MELWQPYQAACSGICLLVQQSKQQNLIHMQQPAALHNQTTPVYQAITMHPTSLFANTP